MTVDEQPDDQSEASREDAGRDRDLRRMLRESQRSGFLGDRAVDEVIAHARIFSQALAARRGQAVIDLGAGGGVPGLVIAFDRPDVHVTLVDRRAKRTDFLERMVQRQGWMGRVAVCCVDAVPYAEQHREAFDAVVARGFGPPAATLSIARRLVRPDGRIVISEPPAGDRWDPDLLDDLDVVRLDVRRSDGRVAIFERRAGR